MLYFYYGDNAYDLEKKLNLFVERYKQKFTSGLNFLRLDLEQEGALDSLRAATESQSMFNETKLVLVRGTFLVSEKEWELLEELIESKKIIEDKDIVVLLYERAEGKELAKNKKRFSFLTKKANSQEFKKPAGSQLILWVNRVAKENDIKISPTAVNELAERAGYDITLLVSELRKLALYKLGGQVTKEDVEKLTASETKTNVFITVDALTNRDLATALNELLKHQRAGDDPVVLIGMFAYQLRTLSKIKEAIQEGVSDYNMPSHLKLHPYVVKKNLRGAKSISLENIAYMFNLLAQADEAIKTGKKEPQRALEEFVIESATI